MFAYVGLPQNLKDLFSAPASYPKAFMLSLQSFLREGRVVGLCWANENLKDLRDLDGER